jgi:hypothetical protein
VDNIKMDLKETQRTYAVVARVTFYTYIWEVLGSSIGRDIGYHQRDIRGFPQSLQANVGIVPS